MAITKCACNDGLSGIIFPEEYFPYNRWDNFWDLLLPWRPPPVRDILEQNQIRILPAPPAPESEDKMRGNWSLEDLEDARLRQVRIFRENPELIMTGGRIRADGLAVTSGTPEKYLKWENIAIGAVAGLALLAVMRRI